MEIPQPIWVDMIITKNKKKKEIQILATLQKKGKRKNNYSPHEDEFVL